MAPIERLSHHRTPKLAALLLAAATVIGAASTASASCAMNLDTVTETALVVSFDASSCSHKTDNGKAKVRLCLKRSDATVGACKGGTVAYESAWSGTHTFSGLQPGEAYKVKAEYKRKRQVGWGVLWYRFDKMTVPTLPVVSATEVDHVWIETTTDSTVVFGWTAASPTKYDDYRVKLRRPFEPYWRNATEPLANGGSNPYQASVTDLEADRFYVFKVIGRKRESPLHWARDDIGDLVKGGLGAFKTDELAITPLLVEPSPLAAGPSDSLAAVFRVTDDGTLLRYFWQADAWRAAVVATPETRVVPGSLVAAADGTVVGVSGGGRLLIVRGGGPEPRVDLAAGSVSVVAGSLVDGGALGVFGVDEAGRLVQARQVGYRPILFRDRSSVRSLERQRLGGAAPAVPEARPRIELQWAIEVVTPAGGWSGRLVPGSLAAGTDGVFGVDEPGRLIAWNGDRQHGPAPVAGLADLVPGSLATTETGLYGVTRNGSLVRARRLADGWSAELVEGPAVAVQPGSLVRGPNGGVLGLDADGRLLASSETGGRPRWDRVAEPTRLAAGSLVEAVGGGYFALSAEGELVYLDCGGATCAAETIASWGGILLPESLLGRGDDVFGLNEHGTLWHVWRHDGRRDFAPIDPPI